MLRLTLLIFLLFVLPVLSIVTGVVPFTWRFPLLVAITMVALAYSIWRGFTPRELGFRLDNLAASFRLNLGGIALLLLLLGMLFAFGIIPWQLYPLANLFVIFYVLVATPVQEFLFRGFLFAEMQAAGIRSTWVMVLVSALTFAFIHSIYADWLTLLATFVVGLLWAAIYRRIPNLGGLWFSHAVLGLFALLSGIARKV